MPDQHDHINYLATIARKAQGYRWMHTQDAEYYQQLDTIINRTELFLLSIVGVLTSGEWVTMVINNNLQNNTNFNLTMTSIQLLLLFLLGIISGIKNNQKYLDQATIHKHVANRYARIALDIQSFIVKHKPYDETFIDLVTNAYNDAFEDSPSLRSQTKERYQHTIFNKNDAFNLLTLKSTKDQQTDPEREISNEEYDYQINRWLNAF